MRRLDNVIALLLIAAFAPAAVAQMYPYPNRYPGQQRRTSRPSAQPDKGQSNDPLPSFAGTVRGLDSKLLTLERPDENTLEFNCSKKTKFFDGDKKIKVSEVKPGDRVSVDAKRAIDGSLDAVNVRIEHQKPSGSS